MNSEDLVGNGKQLKALPFDLLQKMLVWELCKRSL
jgi:hypothetical protein